MGKGKERKRRLRYVQQDNLTTTRKRGLQLAIDGQEERALHKGEGRRGFNPYSANKTSLHLREVTQPLGTTRKHRMLQFRKG